MRSRRWSNLAMVLVLGAGLMAGVRVIKNPQFFTRAFNRLPPNDFARGLIYDGLEVSSDGSCPGLFKVKANYQATDRVLCTHGPDPAPPGYDVHKPVPPISNTLGAASEYVLGTQVTCDGDGTSGYRVQVLYVRASDKPDRYNQYLSSFLTWVSQADSYYNNSAIETGGSRHIRFVHDNTCTPTISDVVLSTTGDDTFNNTLDELKALGYNRSDRKYMIFRDATLFCGVGTLYNDDHLISTNGNNGGPSFGISDAGCWGAGVPAHELMHNLGSVMETAPHWSLENYHCSDEYDLMCGSGTTTKIVCADPAHEQIADCNHDDYFNTNPSADNYLATHWNTANNRFLIGALPVPTPTPTPTPASDTIPPTISITSPLNGTMVARNSTVSIAATAKDNIAVSRVSFFVNGSLKCNDFFSPYSCGWKVSGKPNAQYILQATAFDSAGNTASYTANTTSY